MKKFLRTLMLMALMLPFASQAQATLPFSEEFTAASKPTGWDMYTGLASNVFNGTALTSATSGWTFGTNNGLNNSHARVNIYGTSCNKWLVTPAINLTGIANPMLSIDLAFTAYSGSSPAAVSNIADDKFMVIISTDGGTTWSEANATKWMIADSVTAGVADYDLTALSHTDYQTFIIDLTPYVGNTIRIAFYGESTASGGDNNLHLDNVYVGAPITCFKVSDLAVDATQTTTNSLTLTWTDVLNTGATYTIYDMSDTSVVASNVSGTTYTLTGLTANTSYTFAVMTDCGGGDVTGLTAPVGGRTACDATTVLPYNETFSGYSGFPSYPYYGPAITPSCWEYRSNGTNTAETSGSTSYFGGVAQYNGTSSYASMVANDPYLFMPIYIVGSAVTSSTYLGYAEARGTEKVAIMPAFTEALNTLQISFDYKMSTAYSATGAASVLELGYVIGADYSFTSMQSWNAVTSTQHIVDLNLSTLAADAPAGARLAFRFSGVHNGTSTTSYSTVYCGVDNILVEPLPSCVRVTNLTASEITSNSVTLTWTDATNTGATYSIYSGNGNVVATDVTGTTYTVTGLTPNTEYTFGVVANCSPSDASAVTTLTVRTNCAPYQLPFTEDFSTTLATDPCWRGATGTTAAQVFAGTALTFTAPSQWTFISTTRDGLPGGHYYKNVYGSSVKAWMITPEIDLTTAASAQLSFDVALTDYNNAALPDANGDTNTSQAFMVIISTDGGSTWLQSNATIWQNGTGDYSYASLASTNYLTKIINLNQYLGETIRIAFYCQSLWSGGDNDLHIDNIAVTEVPNCPIPVDVTVSNVTAHTATLSWTGDASSYNVYDMSDTTLVGTSSTTSIDLTGLTSETSYVFGVTSVCGNDESEFAIATLRTLISCPVPTALTATLTPGDGTVATLSWHEVGEAAEWQICLNGDMANLLTVYDTTEDLTGLTAEQACTAKVRAICGADDTSAWSNTITFTPTNAYSITVNDGTTTNAYVPIYGLWVDNITKSQFIIPATDLTAMQYGYINKLTFYASTANVNWGAATFDVYLTETNETGVSSLGDYTAMTQVYAGSLSIVNNIMEVTFTTPFQYMGGNLMIGFLQTVSGSYVSCSWYGVTATGASMGGYGTSVSQRNFLPKTTIDYTPGTQPTCPAVTGLSVTDVTANSATLSWTGDASSYNVYSVTATDTTFVQNVATTTVDLTGLTPMTQYTYGVTADCGSDESDMRYVTFSTACDAVTLPYVESFEATSATRNCWNLVSNNTENVGGTNGMGYVDNTLRFSSYSSATDYNQYGFSPELNVSSAATGLNVKVRYATYGSGDQLTFGYITATDTAWETTSHTTNGQSDMQYFEAIIPATATQLAVHYYGNYAYYAWIDSVWVNELTADYCYPVSGLTVDSVTATSVFLSWSDTDNGGATYTIYGANGNVIATDIAATSYEITGLTASTNYTFGVVANCTATSASNVTTISARTDCAGGSCVINVFAQDSYGDGWNGAVLEVKQGGVIIATYSMAGQGVSSTTIYDTFTVAVCADQRVEFEWFAGSYDDEISFMIADHNGDSLYYAADASEIVGFTFFMVDNPCGVNVADSATVFTTVTIPQHGSVTPDGMISYALGETVTVTATPDSGYVFTYWTIANAADTNNLFGDTVYANPYTFTIDSTMVNSIIILKASFESVSGIEDSMTVFLANNNQAMGTINPAAGEYHVADGDSLVISAVANPGYHFLYWTREVQYFPASITSVDTIYSATHTVHGMTWLLESVHNYTAYFEVDTTAAPNYYTLTVRCDTTMGTVTGVPTTAVAEGTLVTLTAIPNPGYHFVDWSTGETTPTINVTVNSDMTLVANFAADAQTYTVQVLWDETMGNVTGVPEGPVVAGSSVTLMANALTGYRFVAWLMDDDTLSHNHIYTIQSVDDNMTLIAVFAEGVGIDDVDMSNVKIYSSESTIYVNGAEGQQLFLFDVNGRMLSQTDKAGENVEFRVANTGVYLVKVGDAAAKRVVVVR